MSETALQRTMGTMGSLFERQSGRERVKEKGKLGRALGRRLYSAKFANPASGARWAPHQRLVKESIPLGVIAPPYAVRLKGPGRENQDMPVLIKLALVKSRSATCMMDPGTVVVSPSDSRDQRLVLQSVRGTAH